MHWACSHGSTSGVLWGESMGHVAFPCPYFYPGAREGISKDSGLVGCENTGCSQSLGDPEGCITQSWASALSS